MATQVIETPGGISFAGYYYPEILRELLQYLRINKDRIGLTDENDYEVHVQLLRSFALVGHLNNVRLDSVATELLLDSASMLESVKRLLRLIGVELKSATPAAADLVLKLSEVTTVSVTDFVPALAEVSTDSVPPITYESIEGLDLDRTDQVTYVYGLEETDSGSAGSVVSASPAVFKRAVGIWAVDVVAQHLFVSSSIFANGGEFRVIERVNDTDIRVARIPGSKAPGFQTETGLAWSLKKFTTNYATEANTLSSLFTPWATPDAGDMLYVSHAHIISTAIACTLNTVAAGLTGVWEYFDDERSSFNPQSVTDNGSTLTFNLQTLLGTQDRKGTEITVTYLKTGAKETVTSIYSGGANLITTSGLLGQSAASVDTDDYHITSNWIPLENQTDNTIAGGSSFGKNGNFEYDLPQTRERSMLVTDVNNVESWWLRFRIVEATAPTAPIFDRVTLDEGDQYIVATVTQGETIGPQVIGSSSGQTNQTFTLPETPFIDDTETIEIDEGGAGTWIEWSRVSSFLFSTATSRHYIRESNAQDQATIKFGDGINGKLPPAGVGNVRATYRVGGDVNGNVGYNQIVVNAEGVAGVSEVFNPRSALGWRMKDGGDDADLVRVKRDAPAELRTRGTASTLSDIERLATNAFVDDAGTKPVARAWSEEEGFGAKTVKLIVVGSGGTTLTTTQLEELETYFNGDRYARPPIDGVLLANHHLVALNFEPVLISVDATVLWSGGSAERIRNELLAFLTPLALEGDSTTYVWDFGSQVSYSRVHSLIHNVDPNIKDVSSLKINGVSDSYVLGANELPVTTAASLSINIQES